MVYSASTVAAPRKYFRPLADGPAGILARNVLSACHQVPSSRLEAGGSVKGGRLAYQVDFDNGYEADQAIFSKLLRVGPLVFSSVLCVEPDEISGEIARQNGPLNQRYQEARGNIIQASPSSYGFLSKLPINPHVHDITAHMLSERAAFQKADWVVDLGAGDGLLARIALRLGAGRALLVDSEPEPLCQALAFYKGDGYERDNDFHIAELSLADRRGMDGLSRDHRLDEGGNIFLINIAWPSLYGPANDLALKWAMDQHAGLIINGGFEDEPANNRLLEETRTFVRQDGRYELEETRDCLSGNLYERFNNTTVLVLRPRS